MTRFNRKKMFWIVPLGIVGLALFIYAAMWLWNSLMPALFGLTALSYWQTAGLLVLARMFVGFGGGHSCSHHNHPSFFRDKWEKLTPEERERFKERMHSHRWNCSDAKKDEDENA